MDAVIDDEFDKALAFYCKGDSTSAITSFKKIIEMRRHAEAPDLHFLGASLIQGGQPEMALPIFQQAMELSGKAADYHWLGTTYYRLGKYDQAARVLEKALELLEIELLEKEGEVASSLGREMLNTTHDWLGSALARVQKYAAALEHFNKVPKSEHSDRAKEDAKLCRKALANSRRRWWQMSIVKTLFGVGKVNKD